MDTALLHEQLEVVGSRRALLEEQPAAGTLHGTGGDRVTRQLLDALEQRGAAGDLFEHGTRVCVLALEVRQPVRILCVLHPAVRDR